jgi:putative heme iron utilization protein
MTGEQPSPTNPLRTLDADAIRLARTILRTARHGALAFVDADSRPGVSRVGVATAGDGAPIVFISDLSAHTGAITVDPRCALLLGEPGAGDPLAHPRLSITCVAARLEPDTLEHAQASARYLAHNPKAKLYAELGGFHYFRLEPRSATLNGGFGRAYSLGPDHLIAPQPEGLADLESSAIAHMNSDHPEAVALCARHFARAPSGNWKLVGIDAEGIDIAAGDDVRRVWFETPLASADDVRPILVRMAGEARRALAAESQQQQ